MISSETPYKLSEIIQDTWPQLFRPGKEKNKSIHTKDSKKDYK